MLGFARRSLVGALHHTASYGGLPAPPRWACRRVWSRRFSVTSALEFEFDLKRRALEGDVPAAAELGKLYLDAENRDARQWLELAAEREVVESQYLLGVLLNDSTTSTVAPVAGGTETEGREQVLREIEQAKKEARQKRKQRLARQRSAAQQPSVESGPTSDADLCVYWLRCAARAGHGPAMVYLGNVLLQRHRAGGSIGDGQEALLWYQRAASLQPTPQPDALFNLGTLCFSGQPGLVEADLVRSMQYFEQGAKCGDVGCMFWVGHCHLAGEGGAEVNVNKALAWLSHAAQLDHPGAHYHLALAYRSGQAPVDAVPPLSAERRAQLFSHHLHAAADLGDGDALFLLADLCLAEDDVDGEPSSARHHDPAAAVSYLHRAAAAGQPDATVTLGALFYAGKHVPQDKRRAFELYNTAAELGSKEAWRNLASMYFLGDGVPKSEEIAKEIMKVVFHKE